jgi:acyl homoserine lactone synthase
MFWFARTRGARALVALADLTYERFLWRLGVRTRRYGEPQTIGANASGKPIVAVAGEIPLAAQCGRRFEGLTHLVQELEIIDEALVLGRECVSA